MGSKGAAFLAAVKRRVPDAIKRPTRRWLRQAERRVRLAVAGLAVGTPTVGARGGVVIAGGRLGVSVESVAHARSAAARVDLSRAVIRIDVAVARWSRPYKDWSGRLGPVPGLLSYSVSLPERGSGRATVSATVAKPVAAQDLLDAALAALEPTRTLPSTLTAAVLVDGSRPLWLAGVPIDGRAYSPGEAHRRWESAAAADVRLVSNPPKRQETGQVAVYSPFGLVEPGQPSRVLLDIGHDNPIGRGPWEEDLVAGVLRVETSAGDEVAWSVTTAGSSTLLLAGRAGELLNDQRKTVLSRIGVLAVADGAEVPADSYASILVQLSSTGVVVDAPTLCPEVKAHLAPELVEIITGPLPADGSDPLEWEARSVAQRRAAMRGHDSGLTTSPARPDSALPTVTALVVSRRAHLVSRVVSLLAAQTYPRLEAVVALHGAELGDRTRQELKEASIPVEVVELPATISLGEALSQATLRARGTLVTKVDDDDRYGPEHIWDLVLARRFSGATVVGKAPEFVYLAGEELTIRREWTSETYDKVVAGGTIMISRGDLESVGGWRPVPRSVDRTLLERVLQAGGLVYRTHPLGFAYTRHDEGHTWDPGGSEFFLRTAIRKWQGLPPMLLGQRTQ